MESILDVEHLHIRSGNAPVLRDLSFQLPKGATLAVIGPNGAGKTLLFRALIGAIPHEGILRWAEGTRFGYVPQKLDLERDLPLSGMDLLMAHAEIAHLPPRELRAILHRVGLSAEVAQHPIGTLSGGQFHLLLFAFALMCKPTVLLLDEPTAGVDEPGQQRLYDLLHRIQAEQGTTVLLISHELSVVGGHATHVLCLSRQRAWFGAPRDIVTPATLEQAYGFPVRFHV
ncbi:MAG: metal ABC transporter ATP-binding protein, partial [Pseudomonadota bacterium]